MNLSRPEYDMKAMGERMKHYRRKFGFTVEEVRSYMHLSSVQAIYKWESGMSFPAADNLMALAELYQVNPKDLMPKRVDRQWKVVIECKRKDIIVDYIISA